MATVREKIEHLEIKWAKEIAPWKNGSYSRKWLKRQMNRFMRRSNKYINEDEQGFKRGRKPYKGWEY